jgi:Flp pilus assembly protein TadD
MDRGNAKSARGDLDGAIADYSQAIELAPKDAIAYVKRGIAKEAKGDQAGADEDVAQVVRFWSR